MRPPARRILVLLVACVLAAPAASAAGTAPTGGTAAPAGGPGLIATPHVLAGDVARFRGAFHAREAGRTVRIERFDAKAGTWTAVATARVWTDGSYVARWR